MLVLQETWANNVNQVRELMTTFVDDTMRKTNDPEFTVGEVQNLYGYLHPYGTFTFTTVPHNFFLF